MGNIALSSKGYRVRLSLIGFLFILVQIMVVFPVQAASLTVSPQNISVLSESTQYSDVDARNYEQLTLSFHYNTEKLEVGGQLHYGWKTADQEGVLGTVSGRAESADDLTSSNDETGNVAALTLPTALAGTQFQLYFQNTGTTSGTNDQVDISSIKVDGRAVKLADTAPPLMPAASLPSGHYNTARSVTLTSSDDASGQVTIYYTTDDTTPDKKSQQYVAPIEISIDQTIKAIAYDESGNASEVATFTYVIDNVAPLIEGVQYSNAGAATNGDVTVKITTNEPVVIPNGWIRETDTVFVKKYSNNANDSVAVTDLAGNTSETSPIEVKGIDKVIPAIALVGSGEEGVYSGTVSYTATDDKELSIVTINGVTSPASGALSQPGSYTVIVTDSAGNTLTTHFIIAIPSPSSIGGEISSPPAALAPLSLATTATVPTSDASRVISVMRSGLSEKQAESSSSAQATNSKTDVSDNRETALIPSDQGWKLWGVAWYWYALVAGLASAGWWLWGSKLKTSQDEF